MSDDSKTYFEPIITPEEAASPSAPQGETADSTQTTNRRNYTRSNDKSDRPTRAGTRKSYSYTTNNNNNDQQPQTMPQQQAPQDNYYIPDMAGETLPIKGILDISQEGHGYLRPKFSPSNQDIYISQSQIRRFGL